MDKSFKPADLTPEQRNDWDETMSLMGFKAPGFQHLFYRLLCKSEAKHYAVMTKDGCPIAATDGKNILLNPDTFFKYSLPERVFIMCHEVVHNVYSDVELLHRCHTSKTVPMNDGTTLPFDNEVMQYAMDYRINALLVDGRMGKCPQGCLYDTKMATANDSVLDVYKKVYKKKQDDGTLGGKQFDVVMAPGASTGQDPSQAAGQRSQQQWQIEIAAANTIEKMKGKMAGSLQHMFKELLEPEVHWVDHIAATMARKVGSGSYDWRKPDRRFIVRDINLPGRSGFGAGWLVMWGDTSGSISDGELERYMAEVADIIESVKPKRLTILWCDAKIHHVDEVEEACDLHHIRARGVGGRGGTSLHPVMQWIEEQGEQPDMFLGFTDGCVDFPAMEPAFPVVWASTIDNEYPWGEVVRINNKS